MNSIDLSLLSLIDSSLFVIHCRYVHGTAHCYEYFLEKLAWLRTQAKDKVTWDARELAGGETRIGRISTVCGRI